MAAEAVAAQVEVVVAEQVEADVVAEQVEEDVPVEGTKPAIT